MTWSWVRACFCVPWIRGYVLFGSQNDRKYGPISTMSHKSTGQCTQLVSSTNTKYFYSCSLSKYGTMVMHWEDKTKLLAREWWWWRCRGKEEKEDRSGCQEQLTGENIVKGASAIPSLMEASHKKRPPHMPVGKNAEEEVHCRSVPPLPWGVVRCYYPQDANEIINMASDLR